MDYKLIVLRLGIISKLTLFKVKGDAINYTGTRDVTQTLSGKLQSTLKLDDGYLEFII